MFNRLSNLSNRAVLGILIAVALGSSGLSLVVNILNNVDTSPAWWVSWLQNFSTEMFGAFLTFILIELVVGGREKRREEERATADLKARLIRQMRSKIYQEAIRAAEELREHGWLTDGSLHGMHLGDLNLHKADLSGANLKDAYLGDSNLQEAFLGGSNLQNTRLFYANLQNADLQFANLGGATLAGVNLKGASLRYANLQGSNLTSVHLDENTTLPNESVWTPDTDLHRFTDPNHPQFWRSSNPGSPAYRGKGDSE